MMMFSSIIHSFIGEFITSLAVILMVMQMSVLLQSIRQKRDPRYIAALLFHAILGFTLVTLVVDRALDIPWYSATDTYAAPVEWALSIPWIALFSLEILSAILVFLSYISNRKYASSHTLEQAIKEALDLFPEAIAFEEEGGTAVLANMKMNELARSVLGKQLLNTDDLWADLSASGKDQSGQLLINDPKDKVLLMTKSHITVNNKSYTQIVSSDITEEYSINEKLVENNYKLKDIQIRMKAYQVQAADMAISREILNARQIVHDEVGHTLLASRYYLEHPDVSNEQILLKMLRQTNAMLMREAEKPDDMLHDDYLDAVKMAEAIGVTVITYGLIPDDKVPRKILGQIIKECSANAVKHAGGDRLNIRIEQANGTYGFVVTNNGLKPEGEIVETGGLLSLRHDVEDTGGSMTISVEPVFCISILLPVQVK